MCNLNGIGINTLMSSYKTLSFAKKKSSGKSSWTIANSKNYTRCVAIDSSGEFDWISNMISSQFQDGNILIVLDDDLKLQKFSINDCSRIHSLPCSTIASISTTNPNWSDAVSSLIDKEQASRVISNLQTITSGGLVVTIIKDKKNNIRLIPSLMRGKGADLYARHIA